MYMIDAHILNFFSTLFIRNKNKKKKLSLDRSVVMTDEARVYFQGMLSRYYCNRTQGTNFTFICCPRY